MNGPEICLCGKSVELLDLSTQCATGRPAHGVSASRGPRARSLREPRPRLADRDGDNARGEGNGFCEPVVGNPDSGILVEPIYSKIYCVKSQLSIFSTIA
jgi:hypothetical protein